MNRLGLLLSLILLHVTAPAAVLDVSSLQNQFEKKVIERLHMGLDPVLGKDNYAISVHTDFRVQAEELRGVDTYYPKLGMSASTPVSEGTQIIQFENWVRALEIEVARPATMTDPDDATIQARANAILKTFGKFTTKVTMAPYQAPAGHIAPRDWLAAMPWTPLAIVLGSLLIGLVVSSAARRLSRAQLEAAATTAAAANSGGASATFTPPTAEPVKDVAPAGSELAREGLAKWHAWVSGDAASAKEFLERLALAGDGADKELLTYVFQFSDLTLLKPLMKKMDKDSLASVRRSLGSPLGMTEQARLDARLSQLITEFHLDESLDADNLIKRVQDFSVEESVSAAEKNPGVLALFMKCYSSPHVERIVNQLDPRVFEKFLNAATDLAPTEFARLADAARAHVQSLRQDRRAHAAQPLVQWMLVASHLDADRERAFYENAHGRVELEQLVQFAAENFPQYLAPQLPDTVSKAVLNTYPFETRAQIIFAAGAEDRRRWLGLYEREPRVLDLLTVELEQIESEAERAKSINARKEDLNKDFIQRVRKFLRANPELLSAAREIAREALAQTRSEDAAAA